MSARWSLEDGYRITQTWTCAWEGHEILVKNWFTVFLLGTGEQLYVDGHCVQKQWRMASLRSMDTLEHRIADKSLDIRVEIGALWPTGLPGAKIYANGALVGGDLRLRMKRWWEPCMLCGSVLLLILVHIISTR